MREQIRPDLVVNLGDVVEDESPSADRERYAQCMSLLAESGAECVHVAGNHDRVHLEAVDLRRAWGLDASGPLYRSFDRGGYHLVVLYSHETKDVDVQIFPEQLTWLQADLAATSLPTMVLMHHSAADQDLRGNRWFEKAANICLVRERRQLRAIVRDSGRVCLVLNGHLHWNHFDLIDGIPYVTVQSLIENIEEDAPGVPAAAWAIVRLDAGWIRIEIEGAQPVRYQLQRG
jgi:3',5'-cyclic AMP phosphodiesterase CpdA